MNAYRESSPPSAVVIVRKSGLVRWNGASCRCKPPGQLWCWWYNVQRKDRWYCEHGGGWERERSGSVFFNFAWETMAPPKEYVEK